ncbi:MAG: NAD(P)/FAD-dependent oxidoreductase [Roseinatronobacter sp.]
MNRIVVIGAGQAGASLVAKLRQLGFAGQIMLLGEEPVPPYQRPPLSKAYLLGEMSQERLFLRPESFYADQKIDLRTDLHVDALDLETKTVRAGSEAIPYDALALTTGAQPRRLPALIGGALRNVHVVRNLADVTTMIPDFLPGRRVVIVGGGYIGLEAAAVAAKMGLAVTVLEMAPRILQRVAAPETSAAIRALHESHGVQILEGIGLDRLEGDTKVEAVRLSDGTQRAADFVIAGIGVLPETALAEGAGLSVENGIAVDRFGRTSDPHVWAAGDCASFPFRGTQMRLESVQNAIDQAERVAENMLGANKPYEPVPWFWSDQYDLKLQIAGLNTGYDRVVIRQTEALSHWYFAGDRFLAVDALNDPRAFMVGKRLLEAARSPDPDAVADPLTDLKTLLRA